MAFYEHTIVGKQDLSDKEIDGLVNKYSEIINKSGKIEDTFASITKPTSKKFIKAIESALN